MLYEDGEETILFKLKQNLRFKKHFLPIKDSFQNEINEISCISQKFLLSKCVLSFTSSNLNVQIAFSCSCTKLTDWHAQSNYSFPEKNTQVDTLLACI